MAILEYYKKGQGSTGRLLALISCTLLVLWGCHSLWETLQGNATLSLVILKVPTVNLEITWALLIAVAVVVAGMIGTVWFLNRARAVDLLSETEAEMKKVSWPSRQEAWNSSVIVVVTVLVMMGLLFLYDFVLNFVLERLFLAGG